MPAVNPTRSDGTNTPTGNVESPQNASPNEHNASTTSPAGSSALASRPRRATGPQTTGGKRRSSYSALKDGLYTKATVLESESAVLYSALREGLWEEYQPESASEIEEVNYLVELYWRRRRVADAENAQRIISTGDDFPEVQAQWTEAWDESRAGETAGGMLRYRSNRLIVREAIQILQLCRACLECHGFGGSIPELLKKLYGLDHDGTPPVGPFAAYTILSAHATNAQPGTAGSVESKEDPEALKEEALAIFDEEIEILKGLEASQLDFDGKRSAWKLLAASVPPRKIMDGIVRVEAHTSREIERTVRRLEQSRRKRQG
jgi:hypothetical protein